jgi:hypothetical protein
LTRSHRTTLVFQTDPLAADLPVAGQPVVELWVSSDAPDADFIVKLIDVYPSSVDYPLGFALGVSEGIRRGKFRNSFETAELMEPGNIYRVQVDLRAVANVFAAGHRVRVDITGSSWPHVDTNTHTGGNPAEDYDTRAACHTVHHDASHPARLLLPVLMSPG